MKRIFSLAVLIMLTLMPVVSQPAPERPVKEDIFNRKWEFITNHAGLSPADAARVQPLFLEFEEQVWQLYTNNRQIFRSQRRNIAGEKINYEAINDAIVDTELSKANLQKAYYLKLKRSIDAATINKLFQAEKVYQRELIQKMPERPGRPERQGPIR
jgi:hypothetical protein